MKACHIWEETWGIHLTHLTDKIQAQSDLSTVIHGSNEVSGLLSFKGYLTIQALRSVRQLLCSRSFYEVIKEMLNH